MQNAQSTQTDFLLFQQSEGSGAVLFNLVEGFLAGIENGKMTTVIHLTNGSSYRSIETVSALVERSAGLKHLRYAKERAEVEIMKDQAPVISPSPAEQKDTSLPPRQGFTFRPAGKNSD